MQRHGREALEAVVKAHPDSFPAVKLLENFHHFVGLYGAIGGKWHNGWGSYLFDGQTYAYQPETLHKQEELYRYSMTATNALEIGVYVGHSLLLMLLANPTLKITCIDNDEQFARKAVDYLNAHFDNRVTFIHADAIAGVESLPADTFDLVHIDADHYDWAVNAQFRASVRVATPGATIVFDDYEAVQKTIDGFVTEGYLEILVIPGCLWTNCVARLTAKTWEECVAQVCSRYSALSRERLLNNVRMVQHVNKHDIEGDIVEVGVYKGGSMLAMMRTYEQDLVQNDKTPKRTFHLYDTFSGMTLPTDVDKDLYGESATMLINESDSVRCICSLEDVQAELKRHSVLPRELIQYHVGDILKNTFYPEKIAVLRLDTDWYESTAFELENFYDRVVPGGVVIIDDYGHWMGARKAVDEFLVKHPEIHLENIDYTGVYFYKVSIQNLKGETKNGAVVPSIPFQKKHDIYLSGELFQMLCPYNLNNKYIIRMWNPDTLCEGERVFMEIHQIPQFLQNPPPKKVDIVIHNGDNPFKDSHYEQLRPYIRNVYAENCEAKYGKQIPIGFRNNQYERHSVMTDILMNPSIPSKKSSLCLLNFVLESNPKERGRALDYFDGKSWAHIQKDYIYMRQCDTFRYSSPDLMKRREEYYKTLKKTKFVISPPGAGQDCYRIYEALYFGAIPIVLTSFLDPMYKRLGGVMIINDWSEITEESLNRAWEEREKCPVVLQTDPMFWLS